MKSKHYNLYQVIEQKYSDGSVEYFVRRYANSRLRNREFFEDFDEVFDTKDKAIAWLKEFTRTVTETSVVYSEYI